MKGLILAAGEGTRLAALQLKHKGFATVNKKHVIDYSLDLLSQQNEGRSLCSEIVVVVGHNADSIREYIGDSYGGVPVSYVFQAQRKGIAHAVLTAKDALRDDFIMCLADEILFRPRLAEMIAAFYDHHADCLCGTVIDPEDFSMKPIAYEVTENNRIVGVTEKPSRYDNAFRGIGECIFSEKCLAYLKDLQPNHLRGEYEMGDWIRMIAEDGNLVEAFDLADGYCNINYVGDIQNAEEQFTRL